MLDLIKNIESEIKVLKRKFISDVKKIGIVNSSKIIKYDKSSLSKVVNKKMDLSVEKWISIAKKLYKNIYNIKK